jgi:hypothetical protein
MPKRFLKWSIHWNPHGRQLAGAREPLKFFMINENFIEDHLKPRRKLAVNGKPQKSTCV